MIEFNGMKTEFVPITIPGPYLRPSFLGKKAPQESSDSLDSKVHSLPCYTQPNSLTP